MSKGNRNLTKQDRLRTLARMAFEVAHAHPSQFDSTLAELRRFVKRNVDNADLPDALTFDDIADFDVQEFQIDGYTIKATVNDREYQGEFRLLVRSDDEPLEVKDFEFRSGGETVTDRLLLQVFETAIAKHIESNESMYWQDIEADRVCQAYEDFSNYLEGSES